MSPRREILAGAEGGGPLDEPVEAEGRVVEPVALDGDAALEAGIRPKRLEEFVGQHALREKLEIVLEAARRRSQPVDHVLFAGPPGLGKTTLAGIVATEMGGGIPHHVRAGARAQRGRRLRS